MKRLKVLLILMVLLGGVSRTGIAKAGPMGTAFTYQGRLIDASEPGDGLYDFRFELYSDACLSLAAYKVGNTITADNLDVVDGYFTVELDFGTWGVFTGDARWLEIAVAPDGMLDPPVYTVLSPRQEVTPTPYALYAASGPGVPVPLSLSTSSPNPVISGTNTGTGSGIYGEAADSGNVTNYGGHFKAAGRYGRAVFAEGTGESARGVWGETTGKYSIAVQGNASGENSFGVYGYASKTGDVKNYGGYFLAGGDEGRAVYGKATASGGGLLQNYGGYFEAAGLIGIGVLGETTGTASAGVRGRSLGAQGIAVMGEAPSEADAMNYGGHFTAAGVKGRGVYGRASGRSGIAVLAEGEGYDFYAAGNGVNYGASSSIRWKENIEPMEDPLGKIERLRGVRFDWDGEHGGGRDVGMIAEEVGRVLPEIVSYEENGVDATGMDYSKLTPLLVEGVKAVNAKMDNQSAAADAEIERLKEQNTMLMERLSALEAVVTTLAGKSAGPAKL